MLLTGHWILAADLLGFEPLVGYVRAKTFEIFIQLGAILAVIVAYPRRFGGLLRLSDNWGFHRLAGAWACCCSLCCRRACWGCLPEGRSNSTCFSR